MPCRDELPKENLAETARALPFRFIGGPKISGLPQVEWAIGELARRLGDMAVDFRPADGLSEDGGSQAVVCFALGLGEEIERLSRRSGVELPGAAESFAVFAGHGTTTQSLYVYGADLRGL